MTPQDQFHINTKTGRLVADAELRSVESADTTVCTFRIAYDQRSQRHPTGYIDIEVWGAYGVTCAALTKGKRVAVHGSLEFQDWETSDGQRRSKHVIRASEVVFLSPKDGEGADSASAEVPVEEPAF